MHSLTLPWWAAFVVFGGVCAAALWKGGLPERATALAVLLSWGATFILRDRRWTEPQWAGLAIDVAFLAFLAFLALRSNRFWPIWAAGFQLLAVITHCARLLDPTLGAWVYITAGVIWTYLVLFALAFGAWGCWCAEAEARDRIRQSEEFGRHVAPDDA